MIELVIPARRKDLGGGLEVGRVLPFARQRMVGPFIFLDHMGPADFTASQGIDVRPHPHIGLATVTYLFEGEILHRDNMGYRQSIRPGAVNWMTAGQGVVHSERSPLPRTSARVHGMQAWVALPDGQEEVAPSFTHYARNSLQNFENTGARGTLLAGSAYGLASAVETFSPMFYAHVELIPGAKLAMPEGHEQRGAFIVSGKISADGKVYEHGNLLVFARGGEPVIAAADVLARLMLLGGAAIGPRHIWWNFVSSSLDRIEQAKADWRAGRMALPPDDASEFIPLPEEQSRPPHPNEQKEYQEARKQF
jgi:redox-sensitive bicupin YhaK (pirin superfamily)